MRTVKNNTGQHYGTSYRTVPVYLLRVRPDGKGQYLCGVHMDEIMWGELALREAMADDDDPFPNRMEEKRTKVQAIIERTLHALTSGPTTRKAVEVLVGTGTKVSKRHWQEADRILREQHGVQMQDDPNNRNTRIYWRPERTEK